MAEATNLEKNINAKLQPKINVSHSEIYNYDASANRLYFSTVGDFFSRIMIILCQLILCISLFIISGSISKLIIEKVVPLSPVLDVLAKPFWESFTIIIAGFFISISLLFLVPALVVKTIRSVIIWSVVFLALNNFLTLLVLVGSILCLLFYPTQNNLTGVILASFSYCFISFSSLVLLKVGIAKRKRIEATIMEAYNT